MKDSLATVSLFGGSSDATRRAIRRATTCLGWSVALLALSVVPARAAVETLTVTSTQAGTTPTQLGYNLGHFMPGTNAADWFRYSGVNAARIFISPNDIEASDDLAPVGDGVDSSASFFARRALVREQSASSQAPLLETYIKWSAFMTRYARVLAGSNKIQPTYTLGKLRDSQISILANITASESRFPIASADDWAGKWELWQHYYAQAFLLSRDYGVGNFSMFNEPNGEFGTSEPEWIQRFYYCSDAIQSAVADMNARYGKSVVAKVFAPNTANGFEKYKTAPDIWGQDAVTHRHLKLDGTSSPSWMNLQVYNYQKYSMLTHATPDMTGYVTDYNLLRTAINADMVGEPQLPIALSEFNVRTAANYEKNSAATQDSPDDYSALGANCIALTQCGAQQLYLFKFGQTASASPSGIVKNGTHYVQNDSWNPYNYGGATQAAEVYRLFVKAAGKGRRLHTKTATAGASQTNTAGLWSLVTHAPDKGCYYIFLANKGSAPISLAVNVAALALPAGNPVWVEEVSGKMNGGAITQTAVAANTIPALDIPAKGVRLYTIPILRQYSLASPAVADATLGDGSSRTAPNGSATTLAVRADGTANGRKVAIIKVPVPAIQLSQSHSHWLELSVATSSGTAPIQAHIYGLNEATWSEASATWAGLNGVLKQDVGDGTLIEHNVVDGQGIVTQMLGQITASSTTASSRYVDVSDFIKSRTDGFATFLIVQEHRWDKAQPSKILGDLQTAGLVIKSREAGTDGPRLLTLTPGTAPTFTTQPQTQAVFEGRPVTLTVAAAGSAPLTYTWLKNGSVIPGATANAFTIPAFGLADAGSYAVTVGNYAGSLVSQSASISFVGNGLLAFRGANGMAADGSQDRHSAGDGVPYLLKYAFNMIGTGLGQAPTLAGANTTKLAPGGHAGLPTESVDATGRLTITYIRRKSVTNPGVLYHVEFSGNLTDWAVNAAASESVASVDATLERVTLTDSAPVATPGKRFVRVRVTTAI